MFNIAVWQSGTHEPPPGTLPVGPAGHSRRPQSPTNNF